MAYRPVWDTRGPGHASGFRQCWLELAAGPILLHSSPAEYPQARLRSCHRLLLRRTPDSHRPGHVGTGALLSGPDRQADRQISAGATKCHLTPAGPAHSEEGIYREMS